ncbi:MAG: glycosyltransferase family 1 protein [Planctomycetaceae bacterium]|nr:glycosyltransferase family 1 protein [Planctomycetaceae bacterium]
MSDTSRPIVNTVQSLPTGSNETLSQSGAITSVVDEQYAIASQLAVRGKLPQARERYHQLSETFHAPAFHALLENDLATLAAVDGDFDLAKQMYGTALRIDPGCTAARENLNLLVADAVISDRAAKRPEPAAPLALRKTRVAIVSILFNWPSTGGGTIHTAETGKFLGLAGYDVRHIYSQYSNWGIGRMDQEPLAPSEALVFDAKSWNAPEIQRRFREAVDSFAPDFVIVTDSWNFKPLLAEAMRGYRYFLRLAAQECLCPLNNVRLLVDSQGQTSSCPKHQLATPDACRKCVRDRERQSGSLHQAERALSGYGTAEYDHRLRQAFEGAEAVLAVNPLIAATISPFAKQVCVVPSGFDPSRFPWTANESHETNRKGRCATLLFAGLTEEFMKGFHILRAACQRLWQKRRDFELVVTGDSPERPDEFCRYIGWQTQEQLPNVIRASDILMFPTIAEEALGRSAVEAMGAGRPVIASRIGGLKFTVTDGATGLLFEPGNVDDLARKIDTLLDNPELRDQMGLAGRSQFEANYTWDAVINQHYSCLLGPANRELSHGDLAQFRLNKE